MEEFLLKNGKAIRGGAATDDVHSCTLEYFDGPAVMREHFCCRNEAIEEDGSRLQPVC